MENPAQACCCGNKRISTVSALSTRANGPSEFRARWQHHSGCARASDAETICGGGVLSLLPGPANATTDAFTWSSTTSTAAILLSRKTASDPLTGPKGGMNGSRALGPQAMGSPMGWEGWKAGGQSRLPALHQVGEGSSGKPNQGSRKLKGRAMVAENPSSPRS